MPPRIIEIGKPKNHMELINPNCSAERLKLSPKSFRMPARIENVKAVVMRAKQLPLNNADLLMFPFAFSVLVEFMMQAVGLFYEFHDECAAFIFADRLAALWVAKQDLLSYLLTLKIPFII